MNYAALFLWAAIIVAAYVLFGVVGLIVALVVAALVQVVT